MPKHYYDVNRRQSIKDRQKARRAIAAILFLILILAIAAAVFFWKNSRSSNQPIVIKPPTKTFYSGAPQHVIQSDRFSFKSTSDWHYSAEESLGDNRYVYFTQTNNLIEYELDIYFDKFVDGQAVNYVVPVTIKNNQLKTQAISDRCGDSIIRQTKGLPPNTLNLQFGGANYICAVRGSGEKAAAALVGGSYGIPLTTPSGQAVIVEFSFVNNSSSYFGQTFKEVIENFKLK